MSKYHIGRNGPAICRARPDLPNGRECQFEIHGDQEEVAATWDRQQAEKFGFVVPVKKARKTPDEKSINATRESLQDVEKYQSEHYNDENKSIAMKLALTNMSPLAYTPVKEEDDYFFSEGFSATHRIILEDDSVGYFKPFIENSEDEFGFEMYEENSLGATINEVNAYRMSQAMGQGYEDLVPETVIREHAGQLGSVQRERKSCEDSYPRFQLREDQRKAAVFDFAIGSLDRHDGNYLITSNDGDEDNPRLTLIDNSFSFAREGTSSSALNVTVWNMRHRGSELHDDDRTALQRGYDALGEWEKEGTISEDQAYSAKTRIDTMLGIGVIPDFFDYIADGDNED